MAGPFLASGSFDLTAKVWDIRSCKHVVNVPHPEAQINTLAFVPSSPNSLQLAIGTWQKLKIFDIAGAQPSACPSFEGAGKNITVVGFEMPLGRWMYSGGDDGHCRVFDMTARHNPLTPQRAYEVSSGITSVVLHGNSVELFLADQSGKVYLWDLSKPDAHEEIETPQFSTFEFVVKLAVHPNGQLLSGITNRGNLITWGLSANEVDPSRSGLDATTCAKLLGCKNIRKKVSGLGLKYTPDGCHLVVTFTDTHIMFFNADHYPNYEEVELDMNVGCDWNWDTQITADTKYMFTGGSDGKVRLWDIERQQQVTKLEGHTKAISALCLSET